MSKVINLIREKVYFDLGFRGFRVLIHSHVALLLWALVTYYIMVGEWDGRGLLTWQPGNKERVVGARSWVPNILFKGMAQ
jgi:hypothetical protein